MAIDIEQPKVLTADNYYDDFTYMSTSRFKEFIKCPRRQLAIELGMWEDKKSNDAFIVGNYVHSYFESPEAHRRFLEGHRSDLYATKGKTKGQLKAAFKVADKMIRTLEVEELFNRVYHGSSGDEVEKERIFTGELYGIPFKCKVDSINFTGGYFLDLKTMDTLAGEKFSPTIRRYTKGALYNVLEYQYDLQMYIYQQLIAQEVGYEMTPYIMAVSKESIPDKELIMVTDSILDHGRQILEANEETIRSIWECEVDAEGCGHCDYCLAHKTLEGYVTLDELF